MGLLHVGINRLRRLKAELEWKEVKFDPLTEWDSQGFEGNEQKDLVIAKHPLVVRYGENTPTISQYISILPKLIVVNLIISINLVIIALAKSVLNGLGSRAGYIKATLRPDHPLYAWTEDDVGYVKLIGRGGRIINIVCDVLASLMIKAARWNFKWEVRSEGVDVMKASKEEEEQWLVSKFGGT